jgi:hypothetical protein
MASQSANQTLTLPSDNSTSLVAQKDAVYTSLSTPHSIRLLYLYPGKVHEPLVVHLETTSVENAPSYEAMSYVWGDADSRARLTVGTTSVDVPANLHLALQRVRHISKCRVLWADAICINQSDVTERSQQVSIMATIFKKAKRVLVWLGEDPGGESEEAIDFLHVMKSWIDKNAVPMEAGHLGSKVDPDTFTSHEKTQWTRLARLFNVPWFRRVWTVQEIGFATESAFLYGQAETSFNCLMKVLVWLETGGQLIRSKFGIGLEPRYGYGFCVFWYKEFDPDLISALGCRGRVQCVDFVSMLKFTRNFGASDPRDRIYAFLGLPSDLTGMDLEITVDYTKSTADVFTDFAIQYIKQMSGLRILSHIHEQGLPGGGGKVPSWVPIWDQMKRTHELGSRLHYYHAGGYCDPPSVRIVDKVLILHGCLLDEVVWAHEPFSTSDIDITKDHPRMSATPPGLEILWENILRETQGSKRQYDDIHLALSLTLVAGLTGLKGVEEGLPRHFSNFCSYLLQLRNLRHTTAEFDNTENIILTEAAKEGDWTQYMIDSLRVCQNRRFFVTKKGYLGIGPATMKEGDVCCVLFGATVPFILRKLDSQYLLVGECYIHGVMRGEALKRCQSGDLVEEEIRIC